VNAHGPRIVATRGGMTTRSRGRVAVVVAGGGEPAISAADLGDLGADPLVIAADSGLEHAGRLGLAVALVVGDMDSVDPTALEAATRAGTPIERHPEAKDATDLELALEAAMGERPSRVVVITGEGDRLDHALAVALSVSSPRCAAARVEAWIGPAHLWVVRSEVALAGAPGDLVSLLPVHGPARGVTTDGLLYPLADEDLEVGTSRGISNELVARSATVRVRSGVLLAVAPGSSGTHWARSRA
jgi:thiamine pyrophosphokinase